MNQIRVLNGLDKWRKDIEKELKQGITRNNAKLTLFERGLSKLELRFNAGQQVKKKRQPKAYNYFSKVVGKELDNLWRLELGQNWRMVYTVISSPKRDLIVFVIGFMDHKAYNEIFGYD